MSNASYTPSKNTIEIPTAIYPFVSGYTPKTPSGTDWCWQDTGMLSMISWPPETLLSSYRFWWKPSSWWCGDGCKRGLCSWSKACPYQIHQWLWNSNTSHAVSEFFPRRPPSTIDSYIPKLGIDQGRPDVTNLSNTTEVSNHLKWVWDIILILVQRTWNIRMMSSIRGCHLKRLDDGCSTHQTPPRLSMSQISKHTLGNEAALVQSCGKVTQNQKGYVVYFTHYGEHMLHQKHLLIMQLAFWTYSKSSRPSGWHICLFEVPRFTTVHEPHTTPSRTTNAPGCAFKIVDIANLGWWQAINPYNIRGILCVSRNRFTYWHHTSKCVQRQHKQVKTILFLRWN